VDECGTTDIRILFLNGIFMLLLPFIGLYLLCNYIYCKLTNKVFLATEKRELDEAKKRKPICLN